MIDNLSALGLTKTESKLYSALLDLGRAQAGLLSRRTGIHRRSVYDALDRLIEKGLVSYILENEKRFYIAENPKKLSDIVEIQKKAIDQALPSLMARYDEKKDRQETVFFRGIEGLKSIFEDQINDAKTVYIIGASSNADQILKYYLPHYTSKRIKKKLKLQMIYCGTKKREIPYASVAYLPERYSGTVSTNIYGEKVAIIVWTEDPVAILIKNRNIAKTYKNYFDLLWIHAKLGDKRDKKFNTLK